MIDPNHEPPRHAKKNRTQRQQALQRIEREEEKLETRVTARLSIKAISINVEGDDAEVRNMLGIVRRMFAGEEPS